MSKVEPRRSAGTANEQRDPAAPQRDWERGVERVTRHFEGLDPEQRSAVADLTAKLKRVKAQMQQIAEQGDGADQCADCQGACCAKGRYHFTAADLLAYLVDVVPLFAPRFDNGMCPFLGDAGCLIPAPYRPFNCITFNCDRIEGRLPAPEVARFYQLERELRDLYRTLRSRFDESFMSRSILEL
ncbi:hypothetical protein [Geomesophilobacter sediminis]|uniref:Uncharacterized protein n=1 Tax=Geomesophilobacter sediminis TaxID=2798584 RepID=A0A8J7M117_9BACT|nr:hypothetical protein [Geomesophilobacter sediminis]MBJ6726657.1 hypothetical protein [Geomesophilobacter sediminis]